MTSWATGWRWTIRASAGISGPWRSCMSTGHRRRGPNPVFRYLDYLDVLNDYMGSPGMRWWCH